ncbi:DUF695 domain-containing protein [Ruegeria sp. SCPT10]|uniref:DUF695 domain-containing protein n=1 Tax=Ruegeria sp. SCP10 TaxID=3141377 RepID=UPI00333905AC
MSSDTQKEHWDFYSCEIEGKPYSTMVNLSLVDVAPVLKLNVFHCIEVKLHYPDPNHGMTTAGEYQTLSDLEDLIFASQTDQIKYVARQTGGRKRKFYFYGSSETAADSVVSALDESFPAYTKTAFNFEDAAWQTYLEDLYPNAIAMNEIKNRAVYFRLEDDGDDLSIPREIDHSVIFHSRKQAKEFERIVTQKGFKVTTTTQGILKKSFDLLVQRVDAPQSLDPVTFELEQLAEGLGGSYDGWGCFTQKQAGAAT